MTQYSFCAVLSHSVVSDSLRQTKSCLTPMNSSPPDSSVHGDSPGKNTRVGCHALLQALFSRPTDCLFCVLFENMYIAGGSGVKNLPVMQEMQV